MGSSVGLPIGWSWVRIILTQLRFGTLAIPFTPFCLSEAKLKAVGPFYTVKDPTQGVNVVDSTTLREVILMKIDRMIGKHNVLNVNNLQVTFIKDNKINSHPSFEGE